MRMPDFLSHYYEKSAGPFSNLSMLPIEQAEEILAEIRRNGNRFASQRSSAYLSKRLALETKIKRLFEEKGGQPKLTHPHYLILGSSPWLKGGMSMDRNCESSLPRFQTSVSVSRTAIRFPP